MIDELKSLQIPYFYEGECMSLNNTPSSERIQIGFFGKTNAGKSSLINAITGQEISLVSDVKGTTTDPVKKAMELLPLGPVTFIDTPGLDDDSQLGQLRQKRTLEILQQIHIGIIVVDASVGITEVEVELEKQLKKEHIPYLFAYNKIDLLPEGISTERKDPVATEAFMPTATAGISPANSMC